MAAEDQLELWIEALKSEKYSQGKGALQTKDGGYCCLGVLCMVAPVEKQFLDDGRLRGFTFVTGQQPAIQAWLKFDAELIYTKKEVFAVANLNDDDNLTFNQIAMLLEQCELKDGRLTITE